MARVNPAYSSEQELQAKLNQPRVACFQDLAERGVREIAVRVGELGVIPEIVELGAKLRIPTFVDSGFLGDDQVGIADGGAAAEGMRGVAEGPLGRIAEIRRIEPKIPGCCLRIHKLDRTRNLRRVRILEEQTALQ